MSNGLTFVSPHCWTNNVRQFDPSLKPGFHKANFDHDSDRFSVKTKRLAGRMTAQPHHRFVFCVVVVEFAVNGNQA